MTETEYRESGHTKMAFVLTAELLEQCAVTAVPGSVG